MTIKAQQHQQVNKKRIFKIIGVLVASIILLICIVLICVNWDAIRSMMGNNDILSGTMIASLGVNFLSVCNILFGIILKSIQARVEKRKNEATHKINNLMIKLHKLSNTTTISYENRMKVIIKEIEKYVSDINSKK